MNSPIYRVTKYARRDRSVLEVVASGLTMRSAGDLAAELRAAHVEQEAEIGFGLSTMTLEEQAAMHEAAETMCRAVEPRTPALRPRKSLRTAARRGDRDALEALSELAWEAENSPEALAATHFEGWADAYAEQGEWATRRLRLVTPRRRRMAA